MQIIVQIVAKFDPAIVISSAIRYAGNIAKETIIWDKTWL